MNSHLNTDYAQNIQPLRTKIYDVLGWEYNEHGSASLIMRDMVGYRMFRNVRNILGLLEDIQSFQDALCHSKNAAKAAKRHQYYMDKLTALRIAVFAAESEWKLILRDPQHGPGFMERFKTYDDMCRQVERQQRQGGWKSSLLGLGRSWI